MSRIAEREHSRQADLAPKIRFVFDGNKATGDTVGFTNNVWGLEQLRDNDTADKVGHKLDMKDFFPADSDEIKVEVNGIGCRTDEVSITAHNGATKFSLTIGKSIADSDEVSFEF